MQKMFVHILHMSDKTSQKFIVVYIHHNLFLFGQIILKYACRIFTKDHTQRSREFQ